MKVSSAAQLRDLQVCSLIDEISGVNDVELFALLRERACIRET
jgi:hypothetical protein